MAVKREKDEMYEGHGDNSKVGGVRKGTFIQVGSVIPLTHKPTSVDAKSGHEGGGEKHG